LNRASCRGHWPGWLLIGLALVVLLSACGNGDKEAEEASHLHAAPNGDLREETGALSTAPGFLNGQTNEVLLAYRTAAAIRETLQWIPCYCGCGESAGHRSNLECFIHEVKPDGSVIWDDHGTRCGVCVHIALKSAQMKAEGKSDADIRKAIDAFYLNGYAAPTDTSLPPQA